jgi:predicted  nucleic acid-binding Zn-ribbon protein
MSNFFGKSEDVLKIEKADICAAAHSALERPQKSGWMTKQGHRNKSSWVKRYFALFQNNLYYFASQDPKSVVGLIWIEGSRSEVDNSDGLYIRLFTIGSREYLLKCGSEEDRSSWLEHLRDCQYNVFESGMTSRQDADMRQIQLIRGEMQSLETQLKRAREMGLAPAKESVDLLADGKAESSVVADFEQRLKEAERTRQCERTALSRVVEASAESLVAARADLEREQDERRGVEAQLSQARSSLESERERFGVAHAAHAAALSLLESEIRELREEATVRQDQHEASAALAARAVSDLTVLRDGLEADLGVAREGAERLRLSRGLRPLPAAAESRALSDKPLRLWVGTWNVGAADPFESGASGTRLLRESFVVDDPADLYFVGLQEGVSESIFDAAGSLFAILAACSRVALGEDKEDKDRIHGRGVSEFPERWRRCCQCVVVAAATKPA